MSAYADASRLYFFFDYISHNAWLAWHRAPAIAARHGLTLTPVPVVFGAMLSHHRNVGPAELPAKSAWMLRNVLRKARIHGIPIAPPASHPFNPLLALRVTCAVDDEAARRALVDRLYRATWAEGRAVHEPAVVRELLAGQGLPADALLAAAATDAVKQRLRDNTEQALALGIFGVPTLRARGELFWGFDDLEYLEMFLSGRDVLSADGRELAPWLGVRPSVERKRP
ncbi:MAG: 2-hydroxychromene-2-carboxylate isomerase [Gammaproteobacteria bacterium]